MTQPNIVLLVSDQHRADWLGCAGNRVARTPHLDALARDGVRFTAAYCNAPLCVPSRMSMLVGRQPNRTGVLSNADSLPSDLPTFAHALALAGYETVLCGRMHFVGPDQRHGYQQRLVGDITPSYPGGPKTPYGHLEGTAGQGMRSIDLAGPGDSPVQRYDEAVVTACERYLTERQSAPGTRPLFLTVGLYGPHHPFVSPPDLYDAALANLDGDAAPLPPNDAPHPWVAAWFQRLGIGSVPAERLRAVRAGYAGLVNRLDQLVGRVVTAAQSLPGETLVMYLSDHGEMLGDRGMFWKQSFFEGAVAVPLICCPLERGATPGIARGQEITMPVSLVDLAPTLVSLGGAPPLPAPDGDDLTPLLRADPDLAMLDRWRQRPVCSELVVAGSPVRMIRQDRYKLIFYDEYPPVQLFDLAADPRERHDLGQAPEYAPVREALLQRLLADWDPERIALAARAKMADIQYLTRWGSAVGMGPLDLWEAPDVDD